MEKSEKRWFQKLFDNIEGDKVLLMVIIMLYLMSALAIFSATSIMPQVRSGRITRPELFLEQLLFIGFSLLLVFICYKFKDLKWFRGLGHIGFLISMFFLIILDTHANLGFIKAQCINQAWRTLSFLGIQIHVFEVVKVMMVLYLAWAVDKWKNDSFRLMNFLSGLTGKPFWTNRWFTGFLYIYLPIAITSVLVFMGSVSSMLFITVVMFVTIIIGGFSLKQTGVYILASVALVSLLVTAHVSTDGKFLPQLRIETAKGRMEDFFAKDEISFDEKVEELGRNTPAGRAYIDEKRQEIGSLIAIHEGLPGKLPGNSTQKYKVPVMYGDYMYSLIVEEYGLIGAILVILLFLSLLARGSLIARNCDDIFARTTVGGITIMISGQAMMHMAINVGIMPMTGQTLPLISDGKSSLVMFSIALGIVLCISKIVRKQIKKEEEAAKLENIEEDAA